MKQLKFFIKRVGDIVISLTVIILLSPLYIVISIILWLSIGTPILFRQDRLGHRGKLFTIYKFRTMVDQRDASGDLLPDAERLTPIGKFLRRTTLDELPELLNVLKGDMSLVGPRPLLVEYRDLYTAEQWRRHEMPPGMAGPVIAYGRNLLTWEEKFARDIWYIENWSLLLDLNILIKTTIGVIKARGINQPGRATVDFFTGNEEE